MDPSRGTCGVADDTLHFKHLLLRALPLDRVGPVARARARRVASEGDPDRLRVVTRQVVGDLLKRGELLPMAAGSPLGADPAATAASETLYLVRGTSHLVDLGPVLQSGSDAPGETAPVSPSAADGLPPASSPPVEEVPSAEPPADRGPAPEATADLGAVLALLAAMAEAQDLEVGDPLSNVPQVVLGGILALLERHLPAVRFVLQLDPIDPLQPRDRRVVGPVPAVAPFWLHARRPGTLAVIADPADLPVAVREAFGALAAPPTTVAVPLRDPSEPTGEGSRERGLLFIATVREDLAPHLLDLAPHFAGFVARRWRQQWNVNRRIHTDSLTGVHNRAFFDSQFPIELERARRGNFPLALILGDLDWFKQVNDNHGHHQGDLVLQEVARGLQRALRRIDHICRIGGEEFALILPHTTPAEAAEAIGRLLAQPFRLQLPAARGGGYLAVTVSYGAVTYPEGGDATVDLYRKADAMLYLSKERGRNRCHVWRDGQEPLDLIAPASG